MIEHNIDHHIPLDQPQRQSPLAIAFILVKFLRQAARRFWPLILIIVFQQGDSYMAWLLGSLLVISCVQLVLSLISYYKYYFHIKDGELIIQKGVLRKTNLNIPLDRIQTINFQQNVLHQLLGVVSVEVDTAGSAKAELNIDALSRPKAEELRDYILQKKKELIEEKEEAEPLLNEDGEVIEVEKTPVISSVPDRKVFELSPIDLFKVGVSGNHIRTFFLLIGSIFGLLQFTGLSEDEVWELVVTEAIGFQETYGWILIMGVIIVMLVSAFLFTLIQTALKYFGMKLWETEKGFKLIAGLFNRREQSASHRKIQIIRWFTDPLKRIFGLYTVRLYQASSQEVSTKKSITIPGCYDEQLEEIVSTNFSKELRNGYKEHKISPLIITRFVLYLGILPSLAIAGIRIWLGDWTGLLWLLWIPFVWLAGRRYQRFWRWWLNEETLTTRSGLIGSRHTIIHLYKVQAVKINQSPYQTRKSLASVSLDTAAGRVNIPYIKLETAHRLRDYVIYKAEVSEGSWM